MRRLCVSLLFAVAAVGNPTGSNTEPVTETRLCALYESPAEYAGKFVRVRARVVGTDVNDLWIEDERDCSAFSSYMIMLAEFPQNVWPQPPFTLEQNTSLAEFNAALRRPVALWATLEARFDPVFVWRAKKRIRVGEGNGFGKKQRYDGRLVVREISDVRTMILPRR
jgi:hypothetical protein